MSQVNITLSYEELVEVFVKSDKKEAFAFLIQKILNEILKAESEEQIGASRYERTEERSDYRNGTRERPLVTRVGKIVLRVPRHRNVPFKSMIFDNYQRSESALLTTMAEEMVQGVSTRKIKNVVEQLCGTNFSKSTVSEVCKKLDAEIDKFRNRFLEADYPFVMVDAKVFKVREEHRIVEKSFMVALGFTTDGRREVIGFDTYKNESEETWTDFLLNLRSRGLKDVRMITSDSHMGLIAAIKRVYPDAAWQRCQYHFLKNILSKVPKKYQKGLATELREMFTAKTIEKAKERRDQIYNDYIEIASSAMDTLLNGFDAAMTVMTLPEEMRRPLRTTNYLERENEELERRSSVIRVFPNVESLNRLMGAVLMERHDLMSMRRALYSQKRYDEAIAKAKLALIKIAEEQVSLLKIA